MAETKLKNQSLQVTQEAWIAPTLLNSWVNYAGGWASAGYYKDTNGIVHLKGLVKNGTDKAIFILPAGYRPIESRMFVVIASDVPVRLDVYATGTVGYYTGTKSFVSLDGISFRAEQ